MVNQLSYFTFQPMFNAGITKAMAYDILSVDIKEPLLLIEKCSPCSGGSGFSSLSGPLPCARRHITANKMCEHDVKKHFLPSIHTSSQVHSVLCPLDPHFVSLTDIWKSVQSCCKINTIKVFLCTVTWFSCFLAWTILLSTENAHVNSYNTVIRFNS